MTWPALEGAAVLDAARAATVLVMLGGAAVLDLRHRRVPNRYWFPFAGIAAVGLLLDAALSLPSGWRELVILDGAALAICGLLRVLFGIGMCGGADAKALMVVALLMPRPFPGGLPVPAALGILALGSLGAALLPLWLLAWNAAHGHFRLPASALGVRMRVAAARGAKVWPMQEYDADGVLRIRYDMRLRPDRAERSAARFAALEAAGVQEAWFAPQVPLVAFLFLGAAAWLWVRMMALPAP